MGSRIIGKEPCPFCRENGGDYSGDNMVRYENGGSWCFKCQRGLPRNNNREEGRLNHQRGNWGGEPKPRDVSLELKLIESYPFRAFPERGISVETMERLGVRCEISETDGRPAAYFYPYTDTEGNITGYKKRALPKQFSVIGKIKGLFNQSRCKANSKFVIVVEGEHDCLAGCEILHKAGKNWDIVSIPNGAAEDRDDKPAKLDPQVMRELEWLAGHQTVLLMLDTDGPGASTAKALAEVLASRTTVRVASLPLKDTAMMLEAGRQAEWFKAINNAKVYRPEAVVEGKDLDWRDFRKNKAPGAEIPYPKLQRMTWGLRKGEITLVVAGPGLGKSSFCREMMYSLSLQGHKIANIALETPLQDLVNYYVAMDRNIPPYKLMFKQDILPKEEYIESFEKLYSTNNMNFFEWWGKIDSDRLINKMFYFARSLGVDFILLDHASIAVTGENDERLEIDRLFEQLTRLVIETGVGVVVVMHLRKVPGKSFNRGGEIELEDIRGSAGAAQMSWNVWGLERDQHGERKDLMNIRVLKNRTIGMTGLADSLVFSHETGRLSVLETEY